MGDILWQLVALCTNKNFKLDVVGHWRTLFRPVFEWIYPRYCLNYCGKWMEYDEYKRLVFGVTFDFTANATFTHYHSVLIDTPKQCLNTPKQCLNLGMRMYTNKYSSLGTCFWEVGAAILPLCKYQQYWRIVIQYGPGALHGVICDLAILMSIHLIIFRWFIVHVCHDNLVLYSSYVFLHICSIQICYVQICCFT